MNSYTEILTTFMISFGGEGGGGGEDIWNSPSVGGGYGGGLYFLV